MRRATSRPGRQDRRPVSVRRAVAAGARERGASAVEYALIAAGVAGVLIVSLTTLMHVIGSRIDCVSSGLQGSSTSSSCAATDPGTGGGGSTLVPTTPSGSGAEPTSTPTTPSPSTTSPSPSGSPSSPSPSPSTTSPSP